MSEGRGHGKVGGKEVNDPCRGVEGEALLCKESRIDFELVIEDEELVIHGPILIKERLRKLSYEMMIKPNKRLSQEIHIRKGSSAIARYSCTKLCRTRPLKTGGLSYDDAVRERNDAQAKNIAYQVRELSLQRHREGVVTL